MIETVRPDASASQASVVIFDFDGTLSLIRSGWMEVMIPLCVEQLALLDTGECREELRQTVEEFVWRLTGKETIYQMMALADAVAARGGTPCPPAVYKKMYLERLWLKIRDRIEALRSGRAKPEEYMVPGARALLETLRRQGMRMYLASGTDDANVKEEADLLDVARYFEGRIFGAQEDLKSFSKALLVQQILAKTSSVQADQLLVFGDGFVEIEEVKRKGGTAVGVATAEPDCADIDEWKRRRLIHAGADFIIPHYRDLDAILSVVFQMPAAAIS